MTPRPRVPPPQWLIGAVLVGWGTDLLRRHPWDDVTRDSWQQRQDTSDPARGTGRRGCRRRAPGHCCASPPSQPPLADPAALPRPPNPPLAQSTGQPGEGSQKGTELLRSSNQKLSMSLLQEWPDPGRAPDTEALSCHRLYVCKGKGTHSQAHTVPASPGAPPHSSFTIA